MRLSTIAVILSGVLGLVAPLAAQADINYQTASSTLAPRLYLRQISGDGQTVRINQVLPEPLVVRVTCNRDGTGQVSKMQSTLEQLLQNKK